MAKGFHMLYFDFKTKLAHFWGNAWSQGVSFVQSTRLEPHPRPNELRSGVESERDFGAPPRNGHTSVARSRAGDMHAASNVTTLPANGPATVTYLIDEPYPKALNLVRAALKSEGLRIPMEMDVAGRIRHELGVGLKPCRLLCVDCPWLLLQSAVVNSPATGALSLHIVITQSGANSVVHLAAPMDAAIPATLRIQFERFWGRVLKVLRQVGARKAVFELTS